jgi:hypothetical protein
MDINDKPLGEVLKELFPDRNYQEVSPEEFKENLKKFFNQSNDNSNNEVENIKYINDRIDYLERKLNDKEWLINIINSDEKINKVISKANEAYYYIKQFKRNPLSIFENIILSSPTLSFVTMFGVSRLIGYLFF